VKPARLGPEAILFRGNDTRVEVVQEESARRHALVDVVNNRIRVRVPTQHVVDVSAAMESWLRRQAKADITERLRVRGKEMRQHPGRVYVMGQRTKWGGCSRRRNLSFNWRLVMAAPEVLDYIIVHELAHLAEPYHSTKFWLIVRSYCPDYDRHRRWLREHEDLLMGAKGGSVVRRVADGRVTFACWPRCILLPSTASKRIQSQWKSTPGMATPLA